jgi:hypothetical protein
MLRKIEKLRNFYDTLDVKNNPDEGVEEQNHCLAISQLSVDHVLNSKSGIVKTACGASVASRSKQPTASQHKRHERRLAHYIRVK